MVSSYMSGFVKEQAGTSLIDTLGYDLASQQL